MANQLPDVSTDGWKTVPEVAAEMNLKPHYVRTLGKKYRVEYFALKGEFGKDTSKWPRQPGGIECRKVATGEGVGEVLVFNPESIAAYASRSRSGSRTQDGRKAYKIRLSAEEMAQQGSNFPKKTYDNNSSDLKIWGPTHRNKISSPQDR
jgi:hypothetical protein